MHLSTQPREKVGGWMERWSSWSKEDQRCNQVGVREQGAPGRRRVGEMTSRGLSNSCLLTPSHLAPGRQPLLAPGEAPEL